ncbi:hypothetical protein FB451DRAFT_1184366 [Mycena latifolia]|nr:hypothetical protein FB451DRAFT_1184366 [Mycena latifolia]
MPNQDDPTPIAFFVPDAPRDAAAAQLRENNQISVPTFDAGTFSFSCFSSLATEFDASPQIYQREAQILKARLAFHSAHTASTAEPKTPSNPTAIAAQQVNELLLVDGVAFMNSVDSSGESSEDEELDSEDNDNDSVATDASGDADELNVGKFILRHSGTSAVAVDNQAIARVSHELSRHAPKIKELGDCLRSVKTVHSESQRTQMASFCEPLQSLVSQLNCLTLSVPSQVDNSTSTTFKVAPRTPPCTPAPNLPPHSPLAITAPIPPSPERRRPLRKDSYSCH